MGSSHATSSKTPVNIITGSLGSGKTTVINHLLRQKSPDEYWAILVNEYGLVGIDGSLMTDGTKHQGKSDASRNSMEIKEVAGGCICCSAGLMFELSLVQLLRRKPDRLLIEPTGLATLSGVVDTLIRPGIAESIDLRSIICLIDPCRLNKLSSIETAQDQIDASDILLASRTDLASDSELLQFDQFAEELFPQKMHVGHIVHGHISMDLLDLRSHNMQFKSTHDHHTGHHKTHQHNRLHETVHHPSQDEPIVCLTHKSHSSPSTIGWICWRKLIFDAVKIDQWLSKLSNQSNSLRIKAAVQTNEGWWSFNFIGPTQTLRKTGHRRDSRVEVILDSLDDERILQLKQEFTSCLIDVQTIANE